MTELKPIPSLPGCHASSDGTIYRPEGQAMNGHVLKPKKYRRVAPRISGKYHWVLVHRAVAEAFYGPCPVGMECRHLNNDHTDNRAINLCWGTRAENIVDGHAAPRKPYPRRLSHDEVRAIRFKYADRETNGCSHQSLAVEYGLEKAAIWELLSGRTWQNVI